MDTVDDVRKSLMQLLDSMGPYEVEQKKNSIHIVHHRAFLGIHLKKSYLGVNVVLDRSEAIPPADKTEQVSAHRFHHYYKITSRKQLNKTFTRLLREAYTLARPTIEKIKHMSRV